MEHTTSSGPSSPAGPTFNRTPSRKPLAHRISQIEAKIQSAGGQLTPTPVNVAGLGDANGNLAREVQLEALAKCTDVEQLKAMVQAAWKDLDDSRAEVVSMNSTLQVTRAQIAEQRLRAEAAEAQIGDLDAKVQHLQQRNDSLQKQIDPNYKPSQHSHEFTKTYSQRRVSTSINRGAQSISSPTIPENQPPRSSTSLLTDLIPSSQSSIQSSVKRAASSVSSSDTKLQISHGKDGHDGDHLESDSSDSSIHSHSQSPSNGSHPNPSSSHPPQLSLSVTPTIPEEDSSSDPPSSSRKPPTDKSKKEEPSSSSSKSPTTEPKSKDKKGKKKDKTHSTSHPSTLNSSRDDTTASDSHAESADSPSLERAHLHSTSAGKSKSPRSAVQPSDDDDSASATAASIGDTTATTTDADKRRSNPFKRTNGPNNKTSTSSGSPGEESPSGGASPTLPIREPVAKHGSSSKDPFKSKPTPELGNFVVSDTEGSSRSSISNPRLAIWNGSTDTKKRDRKRTGIDTFGAPSPPPQDASSTSQQGSGSPHPSGASSDRDHASSTTATTTSTAMSDSGDKVVKRTTSTSSVGSSGGATTNSSGDYSSFGSKAISASTKKYSQKSIGKVSGEKMTGTPTKPRASTVASEDIATDVEGGPSGRNFRRGPSGEIDSGFSIVDPATHGKKRNGAPSGGRASPVFSSGQTSANPSSPHHPHHHKGKSTGSPTKSLLGGRTTFHRDSDAGSTTDHEGTYHNEAMEAKFRAAAGADRRRAANHGGEFGVAFGVKRGACEPPCDCTVYTKKEDSYACKTCSHFPAQHQDLGQLSDDDLVDLQAGKERLSGSLSTSPLKSDSGSESAVPTGGSLSARGEKVGSVERSGESALKQMPDRALSAAELTTPKSARSEDDGETTTYDGSAPPSIDAHWLLNFADCFFINQLGKGNSSTVFLGEYHEQQVAIKVLRQETHKRDLEDFKKEMEIMCSLRSPHIVHFYGATLTPKLCIVLEYCSQGTLFHYLHDDLNYVDWRLAFRWMLESVRGINTLHLWKPQIVHRDLKTLNLLLDDKLKIKVCDFGLSRYVSGEHDQSTFFKMRGTFAYFAPEVYQGKPFTSKSDVYSLGIILWEICHRIIFGTHTRPFAEFKHINHDFQIIIQAAKGLRPTLPFTTPRPLVKLYEDCVASDPEARPTCQEIIDRLEEMSAFYEDHSDTWDALVKGGVKVRPPMLRRDSASTRSPARGHHGGSGSSGGLGATGNGGDASSRSPSRGELLRTPIASRNLKDDLTRRGVTATILREKLSSSTSSAGGQGSQGGTPPDISTSGSSEPPSSRISPSASTTTTAADGGAHSPSLLPSIPGSPATQSQQQHHHSLSSSSSSSVSPSPALSPAASSSHIDRPEITNSSDTTSQAPPPSTTNKIVLPKISPSSVAAGSTASSDDPASPNIHGSEERSLDTPSTTEPDSPSTGESAEDRTNKGPNNKHLSSPVKRSKSPSAVAKKKKVFEGGGGASSGSDRSRSPSPPVAGSGSGGGDSKRKSAKPKVTTLAASSGSTSTPSPPKSPERERRVAATGSTGEDIASSSSDDSSAPQ